MYTVRCPNVSCLDSTTPTPHHPHMALISLIQPPPIFYVSIPLSLHTLQFQEGTEERKNAFEALKSKDDRSAHEIETQMRKLQRIADSIAQLKSKMGQNARECEERNRHLQVGMIYSYKKYIPTAQFTPFSQMYEFIQYLVDLE